MSEQLTDNADIRSALAGIYRHFQTLDKAHLFDAVIARETASRPAHSSPSPAHQTPSPAHQTPSPAHQPPSPASANPALYRYVTKIPCHTSDGSASPMSVAVQTDAKLPGLRQDWGPTPVAREEIEQQDLRLIHDNKTLERLKAVEEDTTKMRTELGDFKREMTERLERLEKLVCELQEKSNSFNSGSGSSTANSNIITSNNNNNLSNDGSSSSSSSNNVPQTAGSESKPNSNTNDSSSCYMSIRDATSTSMISTAGGRLSTAEHIYEDPRDFDPDSMPRYRAPPPPRQASSSGHGVTTAHVSSQLASMSENAAVSSSSASSQQQQQQQQHRVLHNSVSAHQSQQPFGASSLSPTPVTRLSRLISPSQPPAHLPSNGNPTFTPRGPPQTPATTTTTSSTATATTAPVPPSSTPPPRRPSALSDSAISHANQMSRDINSRKNATASSPGGQLAETDRERTRPAVVLRSASNPNPSNPPSVRPRVKPRLSSVGALGPSPVERQTLHQPDGLDGGNPALHESGTLAIRGIRTRPGLDLQASESDTLVIGLISPFLDTRSQLLEGENSNLDNVEQSTPQTTRLSTTPSQAAAILSNPSVIQTTTTTTATSAHQIPPVQASRPLSMASVPNTIHSITFAIESMSRFKAATKKLLIRSLALELDCLLKLHSKEKLVLSLSSQPLLGGSNNTHVTASTSSGRQQPQTLQTSLPPLPPPSPSSTSPQTSPSRAHVSIIHTGRDVADDRILKQGWLLNLYQPCSVVLNPKELFKVKGKITLLVEIKLDDLGYSLC